jgi:type VI secretion system secreted protein Hcp
MSQKTNMYAGSGDVIASNVSPSGNSSEERVRETVGLSFSKVIMHEYVVQNQQGGSGGTITASLTSRATRKLDLTAQ